MARGGTQKRERVTQGQYAGGQETSLPGLRKALEKSQGRARSNAFWLAMPLVAFLLVFFVMPIADVLWRSVYNPVLREVLPQTSAALASWNGRDKPPAGAYSALPGDLMNATERGTLGRAATRLNVEMPGFRSMLIKAAANASTLTAPYAPAFGALDPRWGARETWVVMKHASELYTLGFYISALDRMRDTNSRIQMKAEADQVYITLFIRTLTVAATVTLLCLLLGYPIAYLIAHTSPGWRTPLLVMVLLPFWTSLIVRTAAWIVLLQREGVVNDLWVLLPGVTDAHRLPLIHNMTGTLIAMTHILLPFMILPVYSVMLSVPEHYTRAARSLGASAWTSFWEVYVPQTMPGVAAGILLVFILAVGFYITPALVGGDSGQLIGTFINFHMRESLNWGLASALSGILLGVIILLYILFAQAVGLNRLRFS